MHFNKTHLTEKIRLSKLRNMVAGVALLVSGPFLGCGSGISTVGRQEHTDLPRVDYSEAAIGRLENHLMGVVNRSQDRNEILRAVEQLSGIACVNNSALGTDALVIVARWSESDRARSVAVNRLGGNADGLVEVLTRAYPEDTREEALSLLLMLLNNPVARIGRETLVDIAIDVGALATEGMEIEGRYSVARRKAVNRLRDDADALAWIAEYSEFEDAVRLARRHLRDLEARHQ